jgi:hypothetical protein
MFSYRRWPGGQWWTLWSLSWYLSGVKAESSLSPLKLHGRHSRGLRAIVPEGQFRSDWVRFLFVHVCTWRKLDVLLWGLSLSCILKVRRWHEHQWCSSRLRTGGMRGMRGNLKTGPRELGWSLAIVVHVVPMTSWAVSLQLTASRRHCALNPKPS